MAGLEKGATWVGRRAVSLLWASEALLVGMSGRTHVWSISGWVSQLGRCL